MPYLCPHKTTANNLNKLSITSIKQVTHKLYRNIPVRNSDGLTFCVCEHMKSPEFVFYKIGDAGFQQQAPRTLHLDEPEIRLGTLLRGRYSVDRIATRYWLDGVGIGSF